MLKILKKVKNEKQAKKSKKERMNSQKNFEITDTNLVKNKKILIVDDVYTTGSSMNAVINLIRQSNPRKIAVLVVAKTSKDRENEIFAILYWHKPIHQ